LKFDTIAFDLDGTLYPNISLYRHLVSFLLKEQRLLRAMNKARKYLRKTGAYEDDFYITQARLMGETLREPADKIREKTERLIYRGWEPYFKKIKLFPYVRETLDSFRKAGIRMGLLSDFPPENKLENLKIVEYWDVVVCSEVAGRLKPDPAPFLDLAERMGRSPENILYVGNSISYDVEGACRTGMKTALVHSGWKSRFKASGANGPVPGRIRAAGPARSPVFSFYDYRQLHDYVLS